MACAVKFTTPEGRIFAPFSARGTGLNGVTEDTLLDGRVRLRQPAEGYRAAIDPVLLAAAVPARGTQMVLDVGCGVGAAALCLAARLPDLRVVGIELQAELCQLARENAEANGMADRVDMLVGSLASPPPHLAPASFNHVMTNPPYLTAAQADAPPNGSKALANVESDVGLADWLGFCLKMLRPKGTLALIHRADRLDQILAALHAAKAGDITVIPLWPKQGRTAKRVIVTARKSVASPLTLHPGLVLHQEDGRYTAEAEAVMRGGGPLAL